MASDSGLTDGELTILRAIVTDAVRSSKGTRDEPDHQLRERLCRYERKAVAIGMEAQTIQVIRSGRRLLGDVRRLEPHDDTVFSDA